MKSASISQNEKAVLLRDSKRLYFETRIELLKDHNGWRKQNLHILMAPSGSGKSTLVRTFVSDIIADDKNDPRVLVYLSEETEDEFLTEFHRVDYKKEHTDRLFVYSDLKDPLTSLDQFIKRITGLVTENDIDILFLDNITTLMIYDAATSSQQSIFTARLKKLIQELDIPLVMIAHTGKSVKSNLNILYDQEDMRGSNMPIMQAQFTYTLHMFQMGDRKISFLKQWKSRGQDHYVGFYRLRYDSESRQYADFTRVNWENFEKSIKEMKGGKK